MSKVEKKTNEFKYIPNATRITNRSLKSFPNIEYFLDTLVKNTHIVEKHVGRSFQYDESVEKYHYYSYHGLFMDYFIRKLLSNQYNIEITDTRTEHILKNPDDYIIGKIESLHNDIKEHYEIYKNTGTKALDIIKSIKIVSLSHTIFFKEPLPKCEYTVNEDNLREIARYFKNLPYKMIDLNPTLDCEYFLADADIIFDNNIICEIKTSKFKSLTNGEPKLPLSKFYQTIMYGFGFYKKTGIKVKHFMIYNPLLGDTYSIELDNIDFELFEKVLKRDVEIFIRLQTICIEEMILDISLFSLEEAGDENKK